MLTARYCQVFVRYIGKGHICFNILECVIDPHNPKMVENAKLTMSFWMNFLHTLDVN